MKQTGLVGELGEGPSVWTHGIDWVLTIGLPTVAVFLIVLRRLSPQGIRRVGSLGIDQFASVAFSVAAALSRRLHEPEPVPVAPLDEALTEALAKPHRRVWVRLWPRP